MGMVGSGSLGSAGQFSHTNELSGFVAAKGTSLPRLKIIGRLQVVHFGHGLYMEVQCLPRPRKQGH
jgi:hypothetical protein